MVASNLQLDSERIAAICERWNITELWLFGSAIRADFRPDSDVDLLVTFAPDARPIDILDWVRIEDDFKALFGRPVDVVERQLVEESRNYIRRREILSTAQPIHVAR